MKHFGVAHFGAKLEYQSPRV